MGTIKRTQDGVRYCMFQRGEHWKPHVHIYTADQTAVVAIEDLEILEASLTGHKLKEAVEWITRHQDTLLQMWNDRMAPGAIHRIED